MALHDRPSRSPLQTLVLCLLTVVLTTGCIVIPVPTGEEPYYKEKMPGLEIGITSKDEATLLIGDPDASYFKDSELVFVDTVENLKIAYLVLFPGGDAGLETTHKRHVLLLSFDEENILTGLDVGTAGDDVGDCKKIGICLNEAGSIMRYASELSDAKAKKFRVAEEQCSIYLHGPGNKNAYQVSLGGKIPVNMFSTKSFIHWMVKPGLQRVVIQPRRVSLDFHCQGGELVFLHFDYRWSEQSRLQLEDLATGRKHISSRRLVLLPTGSAGRPLPPPVFQNELD